MTRDVVSFENGSLKLQGVLYKPEGPGPFPALLYNHGSAPGDLNDQAFELLGPLFTDSGWVFFAPYRRGQGLSANAGPFIGAEIAAARQEQTWQGLMFAVPIALVLFFAFARRLKTWPRAAWALGLGLAAVLAIHLNTSSAAAATMVRLLETDHFADQAAAFRWLRAQSFVQTNRIAAAGNSFGGIQAVLGAERLDYCAVVNASGGAESWAGAPPLRDLMTRAVRNAKAPIFFFQAQNDYDLSPSRVLSAEMTTAHKPFELKFYPAFGSSSADGHRFAWAGSRIWAPDVLRFLNGNCK